MKERLITIFVFSFFFLYPVFFPGCFLMEGNGKKAEEFYQLGLKAVQAGKDTEAVIHFKNAIKRNPSHGRARFELGLVYLRQNQIHSAIRELSLAAGHGDIYSDASRVLSEIYMGNGEFTRAIPILEGMLAKGPAELEVFLRLGDCLSAVHRTREAHEILEKAETAYPHSASPRIYLAKVLLVEERTREARGKIMEALSLEPGNFEVLLLAANFFEKIGDKDTAETFLKKARDDFSSDPLSWVSIARFYHRENRLDDAEKNIKEGIEKAAKDPSLWHILAITFHRKKDSESALDSLKRSVELFPDDWRGLILLGDYYLVLNRVAEAKDIYEKVAVRWPQLMPVKSKMAEVLIAERQYEKARMHIEAILKQDSRYSRGRLLRGMILMAEGRVPEAREDFLRAQDLNPRSAAARFLYGMTFIEEGRYDITLSELMEALEADPASLSVRIALSYVYYKTGRTGSAIDELTRILETQPGNEQALMLRAQAFRASRQFEKAESDYIRLIEVSPDLPLARLRLAETYMVTGKAGKAAATLKDLAESSMGDTRILELAVRAFVREGRYDEALNLCEAQEKRRPGVIAIPLIRAGVLFKKGDFQKAEALLRDLANKYPSSVAPFLVLARAYLNSKEHMKALEIYKSALAVEPGNTEALSGMGRTFYLEGKVEEAIAAYEKVLSINESLAPAANDLAYIYAESERNLERALSLAFKAKEIQPQNPDILDTLGWVQFKKGLAAHAEKNIREAVGKRPLEPLFHYHLGVISYKGGRYQEAISFFKESLRLGLEDEEAGKAGILMEKMNRRDEALKTAEIHAEVGESGKAVEICEGILREGYYWKAAVLLASLYADTNENLDRALSLAKEVSDAFPEYARAAGTLGWVLLKKGSRQTAGRYLHKAVIADPDDPMAHYRLGVFYYEGKAFGDASRELERAVKIGLEKRWADNARRILDEIRRQDSQETG